MKRPGLLLFFNIMLIIVCIILANMISLTYAAINKTDDTRSAVYQADVEQYEILHEISRVINAGDDYKMPEITPLAWDFSETSGPGLPNEVQNVFSKALESFRTDQSLFDFTVSVIEPISLLGTLINNGRYFAILCEVIPADIYSVPGLWVITVCCDKDENCYFADICNFDIDKMYTEAIYQTEESTSTAFKSSWETWIPSDPAESSVPFFAGIPTIAYLGRHIRENLVFDNDIYAALCSEPLRICFVTLNGNNSDYTDICFYNIRVEQFTTICFSR